MTTNPTFDKDGYPTEETLEVIRKWPFGDFKGLLDFVIEAWSFGLVEIGEDGKTYRLATGGWSGNEDLIGALSENRFFWFAAWQMSERGGLHIFDLGRTKA